MASGGDKGLFFGSWETTKGWIKRVKFRATPLSMQGDVQALGEAIKARLVSHIGRQDLPWAPLKPATVARKGHDTVYIDTGEYVDSIEVEVKRMGAFTLDLLVSPKGEHAGSGLSMEELAGVLEYGDVAHGLVARPIWTPVLLELQQMPEFRNLFSVANIGFEG